MADSGAYPLPAAPGPGPAPVPYSGPDASPEPPDYAVAIGITDPSAEVMSGVTGLGTTESAAAHDMAAGTADAPYSPGPLSPINAMGDADAGGRDDVASSVAEAVANATARYHEHMTDTYAQGSTIGDILTLPPSALDPGVGTLGTTDPAGGYYDPPRDY
jgi:hypothetical protein